jgi:MFS family permease
MFPGGDKTKELLLPRFITKRYSLILNARPELGPLIGGFINQYASWRWSFWVLMLWAGVQLMLIILLVPETYHPVLLRNKARALRKETGEKRWKAPIEIMDRSITKTVALSCKRPFELLFLEPMVSDMLEGRVLSFQADH